MREIGSSRGFAFAVAMVITIIGVTSLSSQPFARSSQPTSSQCVQGYAGGLPLFGRLAGSASPGELVLLQHSNSVAILCVEYVGNSTQSGNPSPQYVGSISLQPTIGVEKCSTSANGTSCYLIEDPNIKVSANPANVTLGGKTNVEYTIDATATSRGLYFLAIPFNCPAIPIAIGYDSSELNSSDFPSMGPIPCPIPAVQANIIGSSNLGYTYLAY